LGIQAFLPGHHLANGVRPTGEIRTSNRGGPVSAATEVRGSDAVKAALIAAAGELLAEVGPRALSIRNVADRAGVNHGQIHHYFGGKRGLLRAAMSQLANQHWDSARARDGDDLLPPALSLSDDTRYWRATCQVVMDGDMELAGIEVDEDISVPRHALRALQEREGVADDDLAFKARFAASAALQLGWVAFEDFMMLVADVPESQRKAFRAHVKELISQLSAQIPNG
jgi:AcrR family transcriptional regulator